jgi:chaperonin GroEL
MKITKKGKEAREAILVGINEAADMVKVTLGGKGRVVMIDTPGNVKPTLDGVTVLRHMAMNSEVEDMGIKLIIEAAEKQVAENGDGTSSVSIVMQALANAGTLSISSGTDANVVVKQIEAAANLVIEELEKASKKITRTSKEVFQIAKVSAHGDEEVAKLVQEAIEKTTENSMLTVSMSKYNKNYVDLTSGFSIHSGWLSEKFITNDQKMTAELSNPYILIYEGKIEDFNDLTPLLTKTTEKGRPLVVMSDSLQGDVLSTLAINNERKNLSAVAINPYGHNREDTKARMKDLAIATGGIVISPDSGHDLKEATLDMLGQADKAVTSQKETLIVGGRPKELLLQVRISDLTAQLEEEDGILEKQLLSGRLAALDGGFGVLYVGGTVAAEVSEKKDRVDDALGAVLAALEFGIVPGGGISLLNARKVLKGGDRGSQILYESLAKPFEQILINAGLDPKEITKGLENKSGNTGYDVIDGKYVDMLNNGIIDPCKVEMSVVRNSVSVVSQFLLTEGLICTVND